MVKELRSARAEVGMNQDGEKNKRIRQGRKGEGGGGMRIKHVKRKWNTRLSAVISNVGLGGRKSTEKARRALRQV